MATGAYVEDEAGKRGREAVGEGGGGEVLVRGSWGEGV